MNRALLIALPLALLGTAPAPDSVKLEISLTGLLSSNGQVLLCVWHSPKRFPGGKCEGEGQRFVLPAAPTVALEVPLAPGDYAVSLLHDENGNGKLDKNMLGIPKEGVGFSQNPTLAFSAPSYAATRFDVAGDTSETIRMKYFL